MPSIGPGCHELRIDDISGAWRIIYKVAPDAIVILEVFKKACNECFKKEETSGKWLGGRHHPGFFEPF
jgi:phage-related protein